MIGSFCRNSLFAAVMVGIACLFGSAAPAEENEKPFLADHPVLPVPDSEAATQEEMKPYTEVLEHTEETIDMVPIPGGEFVMGSPESEEGRKDDEGPQRKVKIDPFWMGKYEIPWEVYELWMLDLDVQMRKHQNAEETVFDKLSSEYQTPSQPTPPYADMTFGMGKTGYPAICMTQFAGRIFCKWLTEKTGRYYRLPTEAEWEYACRAGTDTAYNFGDDPADLGDYGWYYDNSDDAYHKIGQKKPNPWGLYDMHGNVSEWVLDEYLPKYPAAEGDQVLVNPLVIPTKIYPRVARGGNWLDDPQMLRSAARLSSNKDWSAQDPQIPQSMWYHTDADFVGFRVVRPLRVPGAQELEQKWDKTEPFQDRKRTR